MNKTEYENQRKDLLAQAHLAMNDGDPDKANGILHDVEDLDQKWDSIIKAAANLAAADHIPEPVNLKNMSQAVPGGKIGEKMDTNTNINDLEAVLASEDYRNAFFKTLQGKSLTEAEMKATAVTAPGTIPTVTANKIMGKLKESPLLAAVNLTNIPGNVTVPVAETVADASWTEESTDSADTVNNVTLNAYQLIKTVEIKANLKAMAIDAFENWIVEALAKKMKEACDKAIITGDGSNKATGMLHGSSITNEVEYTAEGMTWKDLVAIIKACPSQYRAAAKFVVGSDIFFDQILGMTDAGGKPICVVDPTNPEVYRVLGHTTIVDDNMTAGSGVFGDLYEGYQFNFAQDVEISSDDSVGFRKGSRVFRGLALADGKVMDKNALVKFKAAMA